MVLAVLHPQQPLLLQLAQERQLYQLAGSRRLHLPRQALEVELAAAVDLLQKLTEWSGSEGTSDFDRDSSAPGVSCVSAPPPQHPELLANDPFSCSQDVRAGSRRLLPRASAVLFHDLLLDVAQLHLLQWRPHHAHLQQVQRVSATLATHGRHDGQKILQGSADVLQRVFQGHVVHLSLIHI